MHTNTGNPVFFKIIFNFVEIILQIQIQLRASVVFRKHEACCQMDIKLTK